MSQGLPKHPSDSFSDVGYGVLFGRAGVASLLLGRVRTLLLGLVGGQKLSLVILQLPSNHVRRLCKSQRQGTDIA